MISKTAVNSFQKLLSTNDTSSSFASKIPTTTKPSASNVFARVGGNLVENNAILIPFGAGSDTQTFDMRVIGWELVSGGTLWIPVPLAQFSCALSTPVGVAGADAVATDRFCDTITGASWNPSGGVEIVSNASDLVAHIIMDMKGFSLWEITYDMTGATNGNCFLKWL